MMSVAIVGDLFGFPRGSAASNYVKLMAKGLLHTGVEVRVYVLRCTETAGTILNDQPRGCVEGVRFEYTTGSTVVPSTTVGRIWVRTRAYIAASLNLVALRAKGQLDAVIFYGSGYLELVLLSQICRLVGVPFIVQMVEWWLAHPWKTRRQWRNARNLCKMVFRRADAAIVISRYLVDRVVQSSLSRPRPLPCLRMPILTDPAGWEDVRSPCGASRYVLYCADLGGYLHDSLFVINAFSKVSDRGVSLCMVGKASPEVQSELQSAASRLGIGERLILKPTYVPAAELRQLYSGAAALLAPLHRDDRSLARFPSKVADYLMSSRPVVSCKFGEVAELLEDGVTAFLSENDDVESYSEKLQEALDSEQADLIGASGRKVAAQQFDYREHGILLRSFIGGILTPVPPGR